MEGSLYSSSFEGVNQLTQRENDRRFGPGKKDPHYLILIFKGN